MGANDENRRLTPEEMLEISQDAAAFANAIRLMALAVLDESPVKMTMKHLAMSIAVEAMRKAFVLQYPESWKGVIFEAADKLIDLDQPELNRPESKA